MGRIPDDYEGKRQAAVDEDDGPPTTRIKNTPLPQAGPRRRRMVDLEDPDRILDEPRPPRSPNEDEGSLELTYRNGNL